MGCVPANHLYKPVCRRLGTLPGPQTLCWLLLRRRSELDDAERVLLTDLCRRSRELATSRRLAQQFMILVRERRGIHLEGWIAEVQSTGPPELRGFSRNLHRDWQAVHAGFSVHWSSSSPRGPARIDFVHPFSTNREELGDSAPERTRPFAGQPVRWFDDYEAAAERYLRVVGLVGLVDPESPLVASGLTQLGGRWRLAADPLASEIGPPDMRGLLAASRAPVVLACGSEDQLVSIDHLRDLVDAPVELTGLGHNAHVQDPNCIWQLISHFT